MTMHTGIQFAPNDAGKASTTQTGKQIFSHTLSEQAPALSRAILKQGNWRKQYMKYIPLMVEQFAKSHECAEAMAERGLAASYEGFVFHRDGMSLPLKQAMDIHVGEFFHTAVIEGRAPRQLRLNIQHKGKRLQGASLQQQIKQWIERGIIEAEHGRDVLQTLDDPHALDLSAHTFVLLGAGSEVGPIKILLALGATVVAIARNKPDNWKRLIKLAQESSGRLVIPCTLDPENKSPDEIAHFAGADLLTHTPEIAHWLAGFQQPLNIGSYAYLDGAKHVQVVMAMDAITQYLLQRRNDITLSYLLTPSDVYCVPKNVLDHCVHKVKANTVTALTARLLNKLTLGRLFSPSIVKEVKNTLGRRFGILDNLVEQQGPNYVLAKHIQRWRAITAAKQGIQVSCNVAPASSTQSVTSNPFFAAAMNGSEAFGVEVFSPDLVNVLMALQMLSDLKSSAQHERGEALFVSGANHGGAWRVGYGFRSLLVLSLLVGFTQKLNPVKMLSRFTRVKKKQTLKYS